MSSTLDRLVPVLDGTNYREWSTMMEAYLQTQELWEVVSGVYAMPIQPKGTRRTTERDGQQVSVTVPPTEDEVEEYRIAYAA